MKKNRLTKYTWGHIYKASLFKSPSSFLKLIFSVFSNDKHSLPVVAIVGIDGSGKTTLCNRYIKGEFKKTNPLHIVMRRVDPVLPIYNKVRSPLKKFAKKIANYSFPGKFLSSVLDWAVECGDFVDRLFRYVVGISWARAGCGPVFFERYPTDRLIRTVVRPEFHLERFFPHPDLFIHLDVSAKDSVERKKEDGHIMEIQRQKRNNYIKYINQFDNANTLEIMESEEDLYQESNLIIWNYLQSKPINE